MMTRHTYLNRTEYPKDNCLDHGENCTTNAKGGINPDIFSYIGIYAGLFIDFGPMLQP